MAEFTVIFTINTFDAANPKEAAEQARDIILTSEDKFQWYVTNDETKEQFSVDLDEDTIDTSNFIFDVK